jgi:hypothetical protein
MSLNKIVPVLFLMFAVNANAEIPLTESDILGSWQIDKESIHRDGSDSKELNTVWTFNDDGTMVGVSIDSQKHARVGKFRAVLKYRVENGKLIKQVAPGRSKEETCIAEEKDGSKMLLKCKNIYFFMTKK